MPGHDMFDNGEPETGAFDLPAAAFIDAIETLSEPRQMLFCDANPIVRDADPHSRSFRRSIGLQQE